MDGRVISVDLRDVIPLATGAESEDNAVKNPARIGAQSAQWSLADRTR